MSATKTELTGGNFQDSEGNPLDGGYLTLRLSQDCTVPGVGNVCSGIEILITLDSNGNAVAGQYVWSNLVMSPQNNYYRVTGYTAEGQKAWGPNNQQVASGATFNLDAWIPNSVISWFPDIQVPTIIEVNGVPLSSPSPVNFESSDSSVTITNPSAGIIDLQASGGGGGVLGKWPGNWLGWNAAAVLGSNIQTSSIGTLFNFISGSASGTPLVPPTSTEPKSVNFNAQSSGATDSYGLSDTNLDLTTGILEDWFVKVALLGNTDSRYWIGLADTATANVTVTFNSNTPVANFVGFRYSSGTDTTIKAICQTSSSSQTIVDTGVVPTFSTTPQVFEIVPTELGSVITFYINGSLVATVSTNVPTNSTPLGSLVVFDGQGTFSTNVGINLFYLYFLLIA